MKKILLVTDAWAPQANGVVRVQETYAALLKNRGYEVVYIHPELFKNIPFPIYPEIHLALFPKRYLRKILSEMKPDAVHIMTEGVLGWAARSVCIKAGIPFTTWYHSHFQLYMDVRFRGLLWPILVLLRRFHSAAASTMVSTDSLKHDLELTGYKNLVIVPLGVDVNLFKREVSSDHSEFARPIFVYFGRLAIEKSPEEFLKLALPGSKVVIGDGPQFCMLKKKYPEAHFLGRYSVDKKFVEQLSLCDVFVFPSRTETFGLVVLEALACGIPVAAHDVLGPRDIITEGKDGYLGDDLRDAAIKCLELSPANCREKAVQFSWENSVDAFIKNLVFKA